MNAQHLERLQAERQKLLNEINHHKSRVEAITERLSGLDLAISVLGQQDLVVAGERTIMRRTRGSVKDTVISLIQNHAENGLTATEVVSVAHEQGIELDRGSVSSLLSKLKAANVLQLNGSRYKPAQSAPIVVMATRAVA